METSQQKEWQTPSDKMITKELAMLRRRLQIQSTEREAESDPTGRTPSDPGAKLDAGKQRAATVLRGFCRALEGVVRIGTYGADKYSVGGWQHVPNAEERYFDALYRHLSADARGEERDHESHLRHLEHALWNLCAIVELKLRKEETR